MSDVRQITLAELLQDSVYRQWFAKTPIENEFTKWRVYVKVKHKSPWQKRDFNTWRKAYKFVAKHWEDWYDCVLVCKNNPYRPPVVKVGGKRQYYRYVVDMVDHTWCPHCRRPTLFGYYTKHHAFTGHFRPIAWRKRCSICGIALDAIKPYKVPKEA